MCAWQDDVRRANGIKNYNKINGTFKFFYKKNRFLSPKLRRMLCNVVIQPHFDYAWYLNLTGKKKNKRILDR